MRSLVFAGLAMCALTLASAGELRAGSLDLSSSMTAHCLGASCQEVQFLFDVDGMVYVDEVRLFSADATLWKFGSLMKVVDSHGTDVTSSYSASVSGSGLVLKAYSDPADLFSEPLSLGVRMATWSSPEHLFDGTLTYTSNGELALPYDGKDAFSTSGVVTPEPSTIILLGTGLFGLFGVVRRRKKYLGVDGLNDG